MKLAKNEYIIAGNGIVVVFQSKTEKAQAEEKKNWLRTVSVDNGGTETKKQTATFKGKRIGIGYVDQVEVDKNGKLQFIRRDNGDQDHQGDALTHVETIKYSRIKLIRNSKYIYNKV